MKRSSFFILLTLLSLFSCTSKKEDFGLTEDPYLEVDEDVVNFGYEGGKATISISSNEVWAVSCESTNVSLSKEIGENSTHISVNLSPIGQTDVRILSVRIHSISGIERWITFIQGQVQGQTITNVTRQNIFSSGDVVEIDQDKVPNVRFIYRVEKLTDNSSMLSNSVCYIFGFKSKPDNFYYNLSIANQNESLPVSSLEDRVWSELKSVNDDPTKVNVAYIENKTDYSSRKIALLDKSKFVSKYQFHYNYYQLNPLSALAVFNYTAAVNNKMIVKGKNNDDIIKEFGGQANMIDSISVLGLYNNDDNQVEFHLSRDNVTYKIVENVTCQTKYYKDVSFVTTFSNGFLNKPSEVYLSFSEGMTWGAGTSSSVNAKVSTGYDMYGNIRFLFEDQGEMHRTFPVEYEGKQIFAAIKNKQRIVDFVRYDGKKLNSIYLDNSNISYVFRAITHVKDYIYAVPYASGTNNERGIVEFDMLTGRILDIIDIETYLPIKRVIITSAVPGDAIHVNFVSYNALDDSYIISARNQGVIKIARANHTLKWILTPHCDLSPVGDIDILSKVLTPVGFENIPENFPIGQHSATYLPDGNIMCFDNHIDPKYGLDKYREDSRVAVYQIDDSNMTVKLIWRYFLPDQTITAYQGGAFMVPNGNILVSWTEQQYTCEVEYKTNNKVWSATSLPRYVRGDNFRTYKVNLYP